MTTKRNDNAAAIAAFIATRGATVCPPADATTERRNVRRQAADSADDSMHAAEQRAEEYGAYAAAGCASEFFADADAGYVRGYSRGPRGRYPRRSR